MNLNLVLVFITLNATFVTGQFLCSGRPLFQTCAGIKNEGLAFGVGCASRATSEMWYYNSAARQCLRMSYSGCGGNTNRFCNLLACRVFCALRLGR